MIWVHAGREVPCGACDQPVGSNDECGACRATQAAAARRHPMSPDGPWEDDGPGLPSQVRLPALTG